MISRVYNIHNHKYVHKSYSMYAINRRYDYTIDIIHYNTTSAYLCMGQHASTHGNTESLAIFSTKPSILRGRL